MLLGLYAAIAIQRDRSITVISITNGEGIVAGSNQILLKFDIAIL